MPTYEYMCEDCGYEFERFQTIRARPLRKCPQCGRASLRRLIGVGAGVIFKGSGFYETDYRSESYKKAAEKEKGGDKRETDKKETKADSKDAKSTEKTESDAADKKKSA